MGVKNPLSRIFCWIMGKILFFFYTIIIRNVVTLHRDYHIKVDNP